MNNKVKFVLEGIKPLERIEAIKLLCKPVKFRTKNEQNRLEYLVVKGNEV